MEITLTRCLNGWNKNSPDLWAVLLSGISLNSLSIAKEFQSNDSVHRLLPQKWKPISSLFYRTLISDANHFIFFFSLSLNYYIVFEKKKIFFQSLKTVYYFFSFDEFYFILISDQINHQFKQLNNFFIVSLIKG
jgi:hypothetical protein